MSHRPELPAPACRHAPATTRNRQPILDVLKRVLPGSGRVVEVGSGTGEHGMFFATHLPHLRWSPTDPSPQARASVEAWRQHGGPPNLEPVQELDATWETWPFEQHASEAEALAVTAVVAINVIHISPWETCLGLLAGAARCLDAGGVLVLYGPYRRNGAHTAASNAAFDASLKSRDPSWGIRDLETVQEEARKAGFSFRELVEMPANNFCVVFDRQP
ncbi:MAG: DUF938 domain-containing protein [Nannocystaceae bacterium]